MPAITCSPFRALTRGPPESPCNANEMLVRIPRAAIQVWNTDLPSWLKHIKPIFDYLSVFPVLDKELENSDRNPKKAWCVLSLRRNVAILHFVFYMHHNWWAVQFSWSLSKIRWQSHGNGSSFPHQSSNSEFALSPMLKFLRQMPNTEAAYVADGNAVATSADVRPCVVAVGWVLKPRATRRVASYR